MEGATIPFDTVKSPRCLEVEISSIPLAVDLDGSLIRTDSLIESLMPLLKSNPFFLPFIFIWIMRGKAHLKRQIALRAQLDISSLPYNLDVLTFLRDQHQNGRRLIMVTGADEHIAQQIADYLHIFDSVMASNGKINLTGVQKKERLLAEFGAKKFDYLGNEKRDLSIWQVARQALLVGSKTFIDRIGTRLSNVEQVFEIDTATWSTWIRALRIHHWLKNLLVFVPLVAAHELGNISMILLIVTAFFSFGLCASSVYLLNDLLDLPDDRRHPRKRLRPFASGMLSPVAGMTIAPLLLGASFLIGSTLPQSFIFLLALYYAVTLAYSFRLKKIVILDVIILAGLFTIRMMAGSAAVDIWPSSWLLAHSMFLFVSLALVKRYAELVTMRIAHGQAAKARSYVVDDAELLASMGVASAFMSALVLVLYISSRAAQTLYSHHNIIWLVCPVLLYWLCYIWLVAHRGGMLDDPMVFALKDPTSRYTLVTMVIIMTVAL